MPNIYFETIVSGHYKKVYSKFDEQLFHALKPPLIPLKVLRFDGQTPGSEIHLEIGPRRLKWVSLITKEEELQSQIYFIDEGKILPFPLKEWKHTHRICQLTENQSTIVDDIYFTCGNKLTNTIIYPFLYTQFFIRQPIYKKYFGKSESI